MAEYLSALWPIDELGRTHNHRARDREKYTDELKIPERPAAVAAARRAP
jgi:hypothetical protein